MKHLYLVFLVFHFIPSCAVHGQPVAELEQNQVHLTVDVPSLLSTFTHNWCEATQLQDQFDSLEIVPMIDSGYYPYYLLFHGSTYHVSMACSTSLSNGTTAIIALAKTVCSTTDYDCAQSGRQCWPKTFGGCRPCNNRSTCTRTSTDYSLIETRKTKDEPNQRR